MCISHVTCEVKIIGAAESTETCYVACAVALSSYEYNTSSNIQGSIFLHVMFTNELLMSRVLLSDGYLQLAQAISQVLVLPAAFIT